MGKKPIVRLRVYKGQKMSFDETGKPQNENQKVTLTHDTVQWTNFMKNMRANGYARVDVENVEYIESVKGSDGFFKDEVSKVDAETIDSIKAEVKNSFEVKVAELTPEQKKIQELEAKINALASGSAKVKEEKPKKDVKDIEVNAETVNAEKKEDISDLRAEYEKKFKKRPFNGWDADKLREKLAE